MHDLKYTEVIQGALDMLILKTLSIEPMRGFGISRRAGWLDSAWRQTENSRRAKF